MEICINGPGAGTNNTDPINRQTCVSCRCTMTGAQSGIKSAPLHDARLSRQLPSPSMYVDQGIARGVPPKDGFETSRLFEFKPYSGVAALGIWGNRVRSSWRWLRPDEFPPDVRQRPTAARHQAFPQSTQNLGPRILSSLSPSRTLFFQSGFSNLGVSSSMGRKLEMPRLKDLAVRRECGGNLYVIETPPWGKGGG